MDAAPIADPIEFGKHRLFHQISVSRIEDGYLVLDQAIQVPQSTIETGRDATGILNTAR